MWPENTQIVDPLRTFPEWIYERVAVLRGVEDGETPKQGPGGRRAAKQSDQNEAKGFRNLLIFRSDKTEREIDVDQGSRGCRARNYCRSHTCSGRRQVGLYMNLDSPSPHHVLYSRT